MVFLDHGARSGEGSAPRPGRFTPGKDPVPIVQEAGWATGPVWTGAENLAPTGIFFFLGGGLVSCTVLVWNWSGIRRKTERPRAVDFSIMKNPNDTIGNRTRDLPVCSALPQVLRHRLPPEISLLQIFK
jgi:hypothetical protein